MGRKILETEDYQVSSTAMYIARLSTELSAAARQAEMNLVASYLEKAAFEAEAAANMAGLATQLDKVELSAFLEDAWSRALKRLMPQGADEKAPGDAEEV